MPHPGKRGKAPHSKRKFKQLKRKPTTNWPHFVTGFQIQPHFTPKRRRPHDYSVSPTRLTTGLRLGRGFHA